MKMTPHTPHRHDSRAAHRTVSLFRGTRDARIRLKIRAGALPEGGARRLRQVHLHIDRKNFQVFLHAKARAFAAQRAVRGTYGAGGGGLGTAYVVAGKGMAVLSASRLAGQPASRPGIWPA